MRLIAPHICTPATILRTAAALMIFISARVESFQTVPPQSPPQASLKITDVLFEDMEGWQSGRVELKAGAEAIMTFRVEGIERREGKNEVGYPEEQVSLKYDIEFRDPSGELVEPLYLGELATTLGPQDEKWQPLLKWSARLPAWAPSGNYSVGIRVRDELGEQQAEHKATLRVAGESVAETETLQVQRLEFARSERGPWTPQRYFTPADPILVRYKIVGFRTSPEKRVWVEQDWEVRDAEGNVLISQQNAVTESSENFYPPRFLSTNFSLTLDEPKPGAYTLRVTVRDRIGEGIATAEAHFNLRP
jgi:hypothetical protein